MNKIENKKTCETCRHCFSRTDAAGFVWYYCALCPRCIVGSGSHRGSDYFLKGCDRYKEMRNESN